MSRKSVVIAYKKSKPSPTDPYGRNPIPPHNPYNAGGLACNAIHTVDVLREMGATAELLEAYSFNDLVARLEKDDVSHMVIEAVWITLPQAQYLADTFRNVKIVIRAHSKMGFLQVEPEALTTIRQILTLSESRHNLAFASNNREFAESMTEVYGDTLYLPNLYHLASSPPRAHFVGQAHPLCIASFGATRLLKLHPSAALAALQIAARLKRELIFYINADKTPGGDSVRRTIRNMFEGLEGVRLVEVGWQDSETFKHTIACMDLVIQLSATETFCMVAADAIASGVPVIGGPAISWLPARYQVPIDDTTKVAEVGVEALRNNHAARVEAKALGRVVEAAKEEWAEYLKLPRKTFFSRWF